MDQIDFVYVTSYNECDVALVQGLHGAFARLGKSFAVIGYTSGYVADLHRRAGVAFFNLRNPGRLRQAEPEAVAKLEGEMATTLRDFVFPESRYYMSGQRKLMRRAVAIDAGLQRLRETVRFGCMIHKLGAELIRRFAVREAERCGIPTVFFGTFPAHFTGRMFLHGQLWSERDSKGAPARNDADEVSFAEFRALLDRIRERREVISYPLVGNRSWSEFFRFFGSMLRNEEYEFVDDVLRRRLELARFHARNFVSNRFASERLPEQPFYFFPLHVFDDSQITLRNPEFYDQFWLIEYLCRVLPFGMKLVVKLHPGLDGAIPLEFLRRIRKLDNVVLLKGAVNAQEVIGRSVGVIVINSTVAFEALLRRKPVLVMGRWPFGELGMTLHPSDLRELPQLLLRLRDHHVDGDAVNAMLYDLYGEMFRGSYNRLPIDYDAIARAVSTYIRPKC